LQGFTVEGNGALLEKDAYQGIASAMPPKSTILNGFSRRGLPSMHSG
jgi:hypothetical protein